jgi:small neutral amino acid transporter SnatA (MarC family)
MTIFAAAFSLFLVYNVLGNLAFYIALLKNFSKRRQKIILVREMIIALGFLILFGFFGENVMNFLGIGHGIIGIAGGVLLFIVALTMVFPKHNPQTSDTPTLEPMIVPIAIPGMAGPGSLSAVMLYGTQFEASWKIVLVIFLAWIPSLLILLGASYIKGLIGEKGLIAFERFGGLLMCLISIQMIATGIIQQVKLNFDCTPKPSQEIITH